MEVSVDDVVEGVGAKADAAEWVSAKADAERSFETYVGARIATLSRIAYLLTNDHHLAEDLVQQ